MRAKKKKKSSSKAVANALRVYMQKKNNLKINKCTDGVHEASTNSLLSAQDQAPGEITL